MKTFKQFIGEDGGGAGGAGGAGAVAAAPTNSVAGIAGSGDSRLPAPQREPGVPKNRKKRNPLLPMGMGRRKLPV
jgi:hypothetical protein